jgi:hypothetical protein
MWAAHRGERVAGAFPYDRHGMRRDFTKPPKVALAARAGEILGSSLSRPQLGACIRLGDEVRLDQVKRIVLERTRWCLVVTLFI